MLKTSVDIDHQVLVDATAAIEGFGFRSDDFEFRGWREWRHRNLTPSRFVAVTAGDIFERFYRADSGSSWVVQFEDDLINGAFGEPCQLVRLIEAKRRGSFAIKHSGH